MGITSHCLHMQMLPHITLQPLCHDGNGPLVPADDCPIKLTAAPPPLQRMLLHLQNMSQLGTGLAMKYISKMLYPGSPASGQDYEIPYDLWMDHIAFSEGWSKYIRRLKKYLVLSTICRLMHNGWPATHRQMPRIAQKYWDIKLSEHLIMAYT